jgi:hypothetical protein
MPKTYIIERTSLTNGARKPGYPNTED